MKQFEYTYIKENFAQGENVDDKMKEVEKLGKEGWELINVIPEGLISRIYFFKREC